MEKAKIPYKNRFLRWSCKHVKNQKNGSFAKIAWHDLCQEGRKTHFRAHYLFWPKNVFGPKQCKPGKTIKIVVSAEIAQNQKWHLFWEKGVFLTWVKKWVLLIVFLKSCVCWKHLFNRVFRKKKTQLFRNKICMLNKTVLGAFVGWAIFYLGLEGLGVLVFLCLFFFFCVGFVSVLFALFLFSCWIVFGVGSCFVFVLFFLFVCFCFCFCWFFVFVFLLLFLEV